MQLINFCYRKLESQLQEMKQKLDHPTSAAATLKVRTEMPGVETKLNDVNNDIDEIHERIDNRLIESAANESLNADQPGNIRRQGETRRDYLIRTGKITPFSNIGNSLDKEAESLGDVLLEAEELGANEEDVNEGVQDDMFPEPQSHRELVQPGFGNVNKKKTKAKSSKKRASKRQKTNKRAVTEKQDDEFSPENAGSDAESSDDDSDMALLNQENDAQSRSRKRGRGGKQKTKSSSSSPSGEEFEDVDDGNESLYQARLARWVAARQAAREEANAASNNVEEHEGASMHEWFRPHPTEGDLELEGGFRIPGDIHPSLFGYQQTGIHWLQQLQSQGIGGILGDEMGLGKTVQVIAYLVGLHYSGKYTKPFIVVTPATVMRQWVNEFHKWWPPMRVSILHSTGSGMMSVRDEEKLESDIENSTGRPMQPEAPEAAERILDRVFDEGHVLITTYAGLQSYSDILLQNEWGGAILDEGHKIRNPDAGVTMYCKELKASGRIILSGTPIQNNLEELWSLFDFVAPMRLGNLLTFRNNFAQPITKGGRANASNLDVQTAIQCAQTLKDAISPLLLQRYKSDVAADLPNKTEQVLFCQLTDAQRNVYRNYIVSDKVRLIMAGKMKCLVGIDHMRKICNHPDLVYHKVQGFKENPAYGDPAKSGKMKVVESLLDLWKKTGHKTLLFAQDVIMLDIIEKFLQEHAPNQISSYGREDSYQTTSTTCRQI